MKTRDTLFRAIIALTVAFTAAATAGARGVITIPPSHDKTGQMDYEALQAAFLEALPGTTIRLEAGTYYLGHQIFADNFRGTFMGAGKDLTIITTVGVLEAWPNGDDPAWLNPPSLKNPWPALFSFVDGDFTLRDMTFRITSSTPMVFELWGEEYEVLPGIVYILGGNKPIMVRSAIRNVGFEGAAGTFGGFNIVQAVYHNGLVGETYEDRGFPVTGTHVVSGCSFETLFAGNSVYYLAEDAHLQFKGNTFTNVTEGLEVIDSAGRIDFWNNEVTVVRSSFGGDGVGVNLLQGLYTFLDELPAVAPVTLDVRDSTFYLSKGTASAFDLEDLQFALVGTPPSVAVSLSHNTIIADEARKGMYGFALTAPQLWKNAFIGTVYDAGIFIEWTTQGAFTLNDMIMLDAGSARCLLAEDTIGNQVICENAAFDVLDLTDPVKTPEYDGANEIIDLGGPWRTRATRGDGPN